MIALMTTPKKKPGRPSGRKDTEVIQARVSPELFAALERLSLTTRRTKNAELVIALENHLEQAGLWPDKDSTAGAVVDKKKGTAK